MPRDLRQYQLDAFKAIRDTTDDILIQYPTGAGKTLVLAAGVSSLLTHGHATHVLIACPQNHIGDGFVTEHPAKVDCGGEEVDIGPGRIRPLDAKQKTAQITGYLNRPGTGHAITVSHQALAGLVSDLPESLNRFVVVIDEAHHAGEATRLGALVTEWRARDGRVIAATATDFRADEQELALDMSAARVLQRSLSEHMNDREPPGPYAPARVESQFVGVPMPGRPRPQEVRGEDLPHAGQQRRMVKAMLEKWQQLGKPKTMVRVPVLPTGSADLVSSLKAAFRDAGARVCDATGTSKDDQRGFIEFLGSQRQLSQYSEAADVVIGVQRVIEGTDWPWCSDVFVVGIPQSLVVNIQLLGRAMRNKPWSNYDDRFRDRARMTYFVPTPDEGSVLDHLSRGHSRNIMALTGYLSGVQEHRQWLMFQRVRAGLLQGLTQRREGETGTKGRDDEWDVAAIAERVVDLPPVLLGLLEVIVSELQQRDDSKVMVFEAANALQAHPELVEHYPDEEKRRSLALQAVAQVAAASSDRFGQRLQERVAVTARDNSANVPERIREILEELFKEFRDLTMPAGDGHLHQLTGGNIAAFGKRYRDACLRAFGSDLTLEQVHAEIMAYHERTSEWPSVYSGDIEALDTNYKNLDQYLRAGVGKLTGGSGLYAECKALAVKHGLPIEDRSADRTPITTETIAETITTHYEATGKWPLKTARDNCSLGTTWSTLDYYLRKGRFRGLPGGSSLSKEVARVQQALGLALPVVTRELILAAIKKHFEDTREWPSRSTPGEAPGCGMVWGSLNNGLRDGVYEQAESLADLVKEAKRAAGVSTVLTKAPLTLERVHEAIRAFVAEHGVRPKRNDKRPCRLGISWGALDTALKECKRGITVKSSLSQECDAVGAPPA